MSGSDPGGCRDRDGVSSACGVLGGCRRRQLLPVPHRGTRLRAIAPYPGQSIRAIQYQWLELRRLPQILLVLVLELRLMFEVGARASTPRESRRCAIHTPPRHASGTLCAPPQGRRPRGSAPWTPALPGARRCAGPPRGSGPWNPALPGATRPRLCAGRAAAGCERRLALRARRRWRRRCTSGRLGQPNCCHALRARRRRPARPGACMCCPSINCACCLLGWWGCRRLRALRAARDAL